MLYEGVSQLIDSLEIPLVQAHLAFELDHRNSVILVCYLLFCKCVLQLGEFHALLNEHLFRISEHWLHIRIVEIRVQIQQLHGEEPNGVRLPALDHQIISILLQIHLLEGGHDPANLLALLGQATFAENQSPAGVDWQLSNVEATEEFLAGVLVELLVFSKVRSNHLLINSFCIVQEGTQPLCIHKFILYFLFFRR